MIITVYIVFLAGIVLASAYVCAGKAISAHSEEAHGLFAKGLDMTKCTEHADLYIRPDGRVELRVDISALELHGARFCAEADVSRPLLRWRVYRKRNPAHTCMLLTASCRRLLARAINLAVDSMPTQRWRLEVLDYHWCVLTLWPTTSPKNLLGVSEAAYLLRRALQFAARRVDAEPHLETLIARLLEEQDPAIGEAILTAIDVLWREERYVGGRDRMAHHVTERICARGDGARATVRALMLLGAHTYDERARQRIGAIVGAQLLAHGEQVWPCSLPQRITTRVATVALHHARACGAIDLALLWARRGVSERVRVMACARWWRDASLTHSERADIWRGLIRSPHAEAAALEEIAADIWAYPKAARDQLVSLCGAQAMEEVYLSWLVGRSCTKVMVCAIQELGAVGADRTLTALRRLLVQREVAPDLREAIRGITGRVHRRARVGRLTMVEPAQSERGRLSLSRSEHGGLSVA